MRISVFQRCIAKFTILLVNGSAVPKQRKRCWGSVSYEGFITVETFFVHFVILKLTVITFYQVFVNSDLFCLRYALLLLLKQRVPALQAKLDIKGVGTPAFLISAVNSCRVFLFDFLRFIFFWSSMLTKLAGQELGIVVKMALRTPPLRLLFDLLSHHVRRRISYHLQFYYKMTPKERQISMKPLKQTDKNLQTHFITLVILLILTLVQTVQIQKIGMNDKKFESLRKKLDSIGFPQTLNPDSFQLVDKMYSRLFKCMTELQQEKKKKADNKSSADTSILYDRIESLTAERDAMAGQLQQARAGTNLKQDQERIRNLTMLVNNFKIKQEESTLQYERAIQRESAEVASLRLKNEQLDKQNKILKNKSSQNSTEIDRYTAQLTSLVQKKSRQIRELQDKNSKLRIQVQVLEKTVEESNYSTRESRESGRSEAEKLHSILKQELNQAEQRYRQVRSELEQTREENDNIRRDLRRSRQEVLLLRKQETNSKTLQDIGKAGKEKIENMYEEARQQLLDKTDQLKMTKDRLEEEEREKNKMEVKIKELMNKTRFLSEKNSDLQTEIEHISSKSTMQIKRVRQLQAMNISLEKQLKQIQSDSSLQNRQLSQQGLKQEQIKLEQLRKDTVVKDRQIKLLQEELQVLKVQGEERAIEKDKALLEVRKLQGIIAQGSRNLQALQLQKEELMKENLQLRSGKQMLTSVDSMSKSQIFVLKERLQASEGQIEELRSIINSEQVKNKELQSELVKLESALNKNKEKNIQIFEDNKLMAGQIKILQARKNQLHQKVKDLEKRSHMQMEGKSESKRSIDELVERNQELQRQLAKKDKALKQLDIEKDELQHELDQQTVQKANLKDDLSKLEAKFIIYERQLQERQFVIHDLEKKLSHREDGLGNAERQLSKEVEQNVKIRQRLATFEVDLKQSHNEINLLVMSNKQSQRQAEKGKQRVAQLDKKLKDMIKQQEKQRQRATQFSILNNELHGQLEHQKAEVVRLKGYIQKFQQANQEMYDQLIAKDQELEVRERALDECYKKEDSYVHEINSYQRQLENLTKDFQAVEEDNRRLSGERQTLKAERNWRADINASTQDWRTKQEERYMALQQEFQRVKRENQDWRRRCRDLEDMLSEQRVRNCRNTQNLGTPSRSELIESRVESYEQNFNNSNMFKRSRHQSVPSIGNMSMQSVESESAQSAKSSLQQLQRKYEEASRNKLKAGRGNQL